MRTMRVLLAVALGVVPALQLPRAAAEERGVAVPSPPGQISVVTVNAKQNRVVGLEEFMRLYELAVALRTRPEPFNGGPTAGVAAPDVIIVQEMRDANLEILEHLLRERYAFNYRAERGTGAAAELIVNRDTVELQGGIVTWSDVCTTLLTPTDRRDTRTYPIARFVERETTSPFVIAGMHAAKNYANTGQANCLERNMQELRRQLTADAATPVVIGGDFNRRSVESPYECDPDERSEPVEWWSELTAPSDGGRAYSDAVREWHRGHGVTMSDEWTHEQKASTVACDQSTRFRRTRIDYLFAGGAVIAEAHADHPGWGGVEPGTTHEQNPKYSDHRFVWGRFVISGPPQPARPAAVAQQGGAIALTWQPVEGATGYVVYRASSDRPYDAIAQVGGEITSHVDTGTTHGRTYRYSVAPIGANGGHGLESAPARATADARGPRVVAVTPAPGARNIDPRANVVITFNEEVDPASVTRDSITLWLDERRIVARVTLEGGRTATANPRDPLKPGRTYRVLVQPVRDVLGNPGSRFASRFSTAPRRR